MNVCRIVHGDGSVFVGRDGRLATIGKDMGDKFKINKAITGRNNRSELQGLSRKTWVCARTPGQTVVTPAIMTRDGARERDGNYDVEYGGSRPYVPVLGTQCGRRGGWVGGLEKQCDDDDAAWGTHDQ